MSGPIAGVEVQVALPSGRYGVVVARGCAGGPATPELAAALDDAIAEAKARDEAETQATTRAVRDLLRNGKYKPTGRGKPASEYLLKAARADQFPRIHRLVDINNLVSLASMLPISLVDLTRAGTDRFVLRLGRSEEAHVFNGAGQTIGLEDLVLVARLPSDEPCANPVKDSMATKLGDDAPDVMAVLYAPTELQEELRAATERFAALLRAHGGASTVESAVIGAD